MVRLLIGCLPFIFLLNLINAFSFGYFKPTTLYLLSKLLLVLSISLVFLSSVFFPAPWVINVWNFVLSSFVYIFILLWILSSLLEYKWVYYVIENIISSIKRKIVLIENNNKRLRTSLNVLKVKIFENSISPSNTITLFILLLESLDLKYNFG